MSFCIDCRRRLWPRCMYVRYRGTEIENKFGPGTGPIWLASLKCKGVERSLAGCLHPGWNVHNCDHSQDVAVSCDTSPVQYGNSHCAPLYHNNTLCNNNLLLFCRWCATDFTHPLPDFFSSALHNWLLSVIANYFTTLGQWNVDRN